MPNDERVYDPVGFFLLRTPALPVETIASITGPTPPTRPWTTPTAAAGHGSGCGRWPAGRTSTGR